MHQNDSPDLKFSVTKFRIEMPPLFPCVFALLITYSTKYALVRNWQPLKTTFLIFILIILENQISKSS